MPSNGLRGLCAIECGLLTLALPGLALRPLAIIYSAFALADGVAGIGLGFAGKQSLARWPFAGAD